MREELGFFCKTLLKRFLVTEACGWVDRWVAFKKKCGLVGWRKREREFVSMCVCE